MAQRALSRRHLKFWRYQCRKFCLGERAILGLSNIHI